MPKLKDYIAARVAAAAGEAGKLLGITADGTLKRFDLDKLPITPSGSSVSKALGEILGDLATNSNKLTATQAAKLPELSLRRTSAAKVLALPSPYAAIDDGMVHPSVVYVPGGWHGYNRWMAVTPYPGANDDYENPCILASNDGETWVVPAGVANPVVAMPSDVATNGFNSDCHLLLSPDGSKLYLLYRYVNSALVGHLNLTESTDGVTWTAPRTIHSAPVATRNLVSPSMWWDGTQYVIIAHDLVPANYQPVRMVNGGADPYAGWPSAPTNITIPATGATSLWHSFFVRLPDGRVFGLIQSGGAGGGKLYTATSGDNGVTWSTKLFDGGSNSYRSCFTVVPGPNGFTGELYWGRLISGAFDVFHTTLAFDAQEYKAKSAAERGSILYGAANGVVTALADTFRRADAAVMGNAMSGQAWTVSTGTFGIAGNRAYNTTTGNNRVLVNLGAGAENLILHGRIETVGTDGWFVFRCIDGNNYWRVGCNAGNQWFWMQRIVGGAVTITRQFRQLSEITPTAPITVRAIGQTITIELNGEMVWQEVTAPPASTETSVGLQAAGASATYFAELIAIPVA